MTMEITVLSKKRYDELLAKIAHLESCVTFTQGETPSFKNLETQLAFVQSQVMAMQESNNQLADIAFDESRFTNSLMDKVEEVARETAKDAIDVEDIASEVTNYMDIAEDVERVCERLGYVGKDDVNDLIQDCINDEDLVSESKAEQLIEDYIAHNCDFVEKDVTDTLHDDIQELKNEVRNMKQEIIDAVIQVLINKLTGKDTHHANDTNTGDYNLLISRTIAEGQASSERQASA
jgi:hypothetical protein